MKVEMLMNGNQKIVLVPENDLEKMFLESFSKLPEITVTAISKQTPILNNIIHSGIIFEPVKKD